MNDLISRPAAQDELYGGDFEQYFDSVFDGDFNRFRRAVVRMLEALPTAQRWIPVTERLPKFDELVLVWVENKDPKGRFNRPGIHTAQLIDRKPEHDPEGKKNIWGIPGYDSKWTVWAWSYFSEPDVKAWMPLPEPYKEENHEQVQG